MTKKIISFFEIIFFVLLVISGVIGWFFFREVYLDISTISNRFDNELQDLLVKRGFSDVDILENYRKETHSKNIRWVQYFKKIKVHSNININELIKDISSIAKRYKLVISIDDKNKNQIIIEVRKGQKVVSKNIFLFTNITERTIQVAIVLDDAGYSKDISKFIDLGIPITFAIMPNERYSLFLANDLKKRGIPYLLHIPLEPENYPQIDPGKSALLLNMSNSELSKKFEEALKSVPGAVGISNHMGSKFSENKEKMRILLSLVKQKGMFYFDSYTSTKSCALETANELKVPCLRNNLFLDINDEPIEVHKQLRLLLNIAKRDGTAIAIGHVHKKHIIEALEKSIKEFRDNKVKFVYLTDILKSKNYVDSWN